jgi:hypothetical protein
MGLKNKVRTVQVILSCIIIAFAFANFVCASYIDNGDGTVTDTITSLVWQQVDDGQARTWQNALKYCEDLDLANETDWRLPNLRELQSIVDDARYNPAINPAFRCSQHPFPPYYWSGSTYANSPNFAWAVNHYGYAINSQNKSTSIDQMFTRCVRGGPTLPSVYGIFIGNDFSGDDLKAGKVATDLYNNFSNLRNVVYRKLLTDEGWRPVTKKRINDELQKIKDMIRPNDILFVYIAGHGSRSLVLGYDETTYTIGDEYVILSEKLAFLDPFILTDDELTEMLRGMDNVQKWVLIDACRGGGFWGNNYAGDSGDLEKLPKTSLFAAATETAFGRFLRIDGIPEAEDPYRNHPDFRKSLFGIAVREAIKLKANGNVQADKDNNGQGNGILTFEELTSWVRNDAKTYFPQNLSLYLDSIFLATNEFGDPTAFSWNEWDPVKQQTNDFIGAITTKPTSSIIAKANGPYSTFVGNVINLDATGSSTPNGDILTYEWDIDNDGIYDISSNSSTAIHTYSQPYDGVIRLRVIDNQGLIDFDSASMFVSSSLSGDFDNDCDVDGSDLSAYILNYNVISDSISSEEFGENFGYILCH